jgi:hypothetical protein
VILVFEIFGTRS